MAVRVKFQYMPSKFRSCATTPVVLPNGVICDQLVPPLELQYSVVLFAQKGFQPVIDAIIDLAEHAAKEPWDFQAEDLDPLKDKIKALVGKESRPHMRAFLAGQGFTMD